jgi:hypothetical protein
LHHFVVFTIKIELKNSKESDKIINTYENEVDMQLNHIQRPQIRALAKPTTRII